MESKNKKDKSAKIGAVARRMYLACFIGLFILIGSGAIYHVYSNELERNIKEPVKLPVDLSDFPEKIGNWKGKDINLPQDVLDIAGNDDYICRNYTNETGRKGINLYVAYSARPRYMKGHRPITCYRGAGWNYERTDIRELTTHEGMKLSCMIHHFSRVIPAEENVVVLNFYLVNGKITLEEKSFSGLSFRSPNLEGNPARYVAQVQIVSPYEDSALEAGYDMIDLIMKYFPDSSGNVAITSQKANK